MQLNKISKQNNYNFISMETVDEIEITAPIHFFAKKD